MQWVDWFLVVYFLFATLILIGSVGEQREPLKPEVAMVGGILNTAIVFWLLHSNGVLG